MKLLKQLSVLLGSAVIGMNFITQNALSQSFEALNKVGFALVDLEYPGSEAEGPLTVGVWYPTVSTPEEFTYGGPTKGNVAIDGKPDTASGPYPLLVFSHGYGGFGFSAVFLTESLAARGWIVVAPDHHDKYSAGRMRTGRVRGMDKRGSLTFVKELSSSTHADRSKYLYRVHEIEAAIQEILEHPRFKNLIDPKRIAVGGHSFGGYTALGVTGTIKEKHDPRVKAALLFSTGAGGYLYSEAELKSVSIPTMLLIGQKERKQKRGDKTMLEVSEKIFNNVASPKYFLEVKGANHFTFNDQLFSTPGAWLLSGGERKFDVIRRYSIAFLEKHVTGRQDLAPQLEKNDAMLTVYQAVG